MAAQRQPVHSSVSGGLKRRLILRQDLAAPQAPPARLQMEMTIVNKIAASAIAVSAGSYPFFDVRL
jgi:hypothetical protein